MTLPYQCMTTTKAPSGSVARAFGTIRTARPLPALPKSVWVEIFRNLEIPDLIAFADAFPQFCPLLDTLADWTKIYHQKFPHFRQRLDFKLFSQRWRRLYKVDLKEDLDLRIKPSSKVKTAVKQLGTCVLLDCDGSLYATRNFKKIDGTASRISSSPAITWTKDRVWYRDPGFLWHDKRIDLDMTAAAIDAEFIYGYTKNSGIFKISHRNLAQTENLGAPIMISQSREPIVQLLKIPSSLLCLNQDGSLQQLDGLILPTPQLKKVVAWKDGFIGLTFNGELFHEDSIISFIEPICDLVTTFDFIVSLSVKGNVYIHSPPPALRIKDPILAPGRVLEISLSFFRRYLLLLIADDTVKETRTQFLSSIKDTAERLRSFATSQPDIGAGLFLV